MNSPHNWGEGVPVSHMLSGPSQVSKWNRSCAVVLMQIYQLSLKSEECSDVHRTLFIECLCAFTPGEIGDVTR